MLPTPYSYEKMDKTIVRAAKKCECESSRNYPSQWKFINTISESAMASQRKNGIPAAVIIAQACLETGYGKKITKDKYTGKNSNNLFNIKGTGPAGYVIADTYEYGKGKKEKVEAKFRAYNNFEESFEDHAKLFTKNKRYQKAMNYKDDPEKFAEELQKCGYATDPKYAAKLQWIMKTFCLIDVAKDPLIALTGSYSDHGTDTDGDGIYDYLTVEAEVHVTTAGNYSVSGWLTNNGTAVVWTSNHTYLDAGIQTMELNFDGIDIHQHSVNGVYTLSIKLYDDYLNLVDYQYNAYDTSVYYYELFQKGAVEFTGNYSDRGMDTDGDGFFDYLTVEAAVNVTTAGNYRISGWLNTNNGTAMVWTSNHTDLNAGIQTVELNFDGIAIHGRGHDK